MSGKKLRVVLFLCVIVIIGVLVLKFSKSGNILDSRYGGTLTFGRGSDSLTLDPGNTADGESIKIVTQMTEGLLRINPISSELEPCLATSWDMSEDGLEWTFSLRKNVKFHDNTPFNADAVVFSLKRQMDKNHPFHEGKFVYWDYMYTNIKDVVKVDDFTVKIIIDKPYAPLLANLAIFPCGIISPTAMKEKGVEGFSKSPVGTGYFKFVEWVKGERIVLEANKDYWDGRPYVDNLIFKVIKENELRILQLESNSIDVMDSISPKNVGRIDRDPDFKVLSRSGLNVAYMSMNCQKPPFTNKKVRQAINHVINKNAIIKLFYQNLAIAAKNPIPPSIWGYNDDIKGYDYSIEKAKELMVEAGFANGFKTTLDVMENARPYMPDPVKIAETIKDNLSELNIEVEIRVNPWKEHLDKGYNGENQMFIVGWMGDNGDPDNFLYVLLDKDNAEKGKSQNCAFYINEELHDILIEAQQDKDLKKRAVLYRQAQEIIHEDAPWVPLAHTKDLVAVNKKVKGVIVQPLFPHAYLKEAWIEEK